MAGVTNQKRDQAVLLALFIVVATLAVVFLYNLWTTNVFCHEIEQLNHQLYHLQLKSDKMKSELQELKNSTGKAELVEIASTGVDNETQDAMDDLQESLDKPQQEQTEGIQQSNKTKANTAKTVAQLSQKVEEMQSEMDSLKVNATNMYKGVESLGSQVNQHINHHPTVSLDGLCLTMRQQCTVPSSRQGSYWKSCATPRTTLKQTGKVTLYRGCSFHPLHQFQEYHESLTLQEDNGSVWCDCDVTFPGEDSDRQRSISNDFRGTCYLTIIHCSSI